MHPFKYRKPDLGNRRDGSILMHVVRNFITTSPVVHELFFAGLSTDSSRKVLKRLRERKLLVRYNYGGNAFYYRLGEQAIARWGYPRSRSVQLGAQRLPYEIGCLACTCMGERVRKRLLSHEVKNRLPWFPTTLMQWAYLWEQNRLGSIRVEAKCSRPDRVVAKLASQVFTYSRQPEFRQQIESGRFFFVVVTATDHQEYAIQHEVDEQNFTVPLQTMHYPELIRFI